MRPVLKDIHKEFIYDTYAQIVDNPVDYEKISRFKMHAEAIIVLNEKPEKLKKILPVHQFDQMLYFADNLNENGHFYADDVYFSGPSCMMLFGFEKFDENSKTFKMLPNVKDYLQGFEYSEQEKELNYFLYVVKGMVETYGIVSFVDIDDIYAKQRKQLYKKFPPMRIEKNKEVQNYILNKRHAVYLDGIVHEDIEYENIHDYLALHKELYPLDFYYNMGRFKLPFLKTDDYQNMKHDNSTVFKTEFLRTRLQNDPKGISILEELEKMGLSQSEMLEKIQQILLHTPIWKYGGLGILDYKTPKEATLPEDMQQDYLTYIEGFIKFGNHKYRMFPKRNNLSDKQAFEILNQVITKENILEMYGKSRFYPNVEHREEFKIGLENAIKIQRGYAFGYEDGKLLIYKDNFIFEVTGITHTLEDNLPKEILPVLVDVVLIPLDNSITYGISIQSMPTLHFGPNILKIFDEEIKQAKRVKSIFDVQ